MRKFNLSSKQVAILYYAISITLWIAFCIVTFCMKRIDLPILGILFILLLSYNFYKNFNNLKKWQEKSTLKN